MSIQRLNKSRFFAIRIDRIIVRDAVKRIVVTHRESNVEKLVLTRRQYAYIFPGAD